METVAALLGVLLALSAAGPAPGRALYLYEDGPAAGYEVAAADDPHRKMPAHRRYYIGGINQANMKLVNERVVDSYFKVLRPTPPPPALATPPTVERALATEPPQSQKQTRHEHAPKRDRHRDGDRAPRERDEPRRDDELFKQNRKEYFKKHSVYEKHTVVSRGNKRNGQRHRRPNLAAHPYAPNVLLPQASDDAGRRAAPRSPHYGKEYRKRNTIDRMDEHRSDTYKSTGRRNVPARIGRPAESAASAPYALFYRTGDAPERAHSARYRGSASNHVDLNVGRKGASFGL